MKKYINVQQKHSQSLHEEIYIFHIYCLFFKSYTILSEGKTVYFLMGSHVSVHMYSEDVLYFCQPIVGGLSPAAELESNTMIFTVASV